MRVWGIGFRVSGLEFRTYGSGRALHGVWVVRAGRDHGELRSWHYIYVNSVESRPIMKVGSRISGSEVCVISPEGDKSDNRNYQLPADIADHLRTTASQK